MGVRIKTKNHVNFDPVNNVWNIEAVIICDAISDLPNADQFDGYHLVMGTLAIIVSGGTQYRINSNGVWKVNNSPFDGTAQTYNRIMRNWFLERNADGMNPVELTKLVNEWYAYSRDNWDGGTTFAQPNISSSSDGTKIGDNSSLVCIPSTSVQENQDDYAGLPLFAVSTVNWILDSDGNPLISAIKGISSDYEQSNPDKYVGVMQMSGYTWRDETDESYTIGYTANSNAQHENMSPLPESVNVDGSIRQFVVHSKYMSKTVSGKMTCCSGMIPTSSNSHDSLITLSSKNGNQYSGGTIIDWSFLVLMTMIKYGSMTQDGRIQGCVNYNYQYYAQVSESDTTRIILPKSAAEALVVGSSVIIGTYNGSSTDRSTAANYSISTSAGCIITDIHLVTINDTIYTAVFVDLPPFSSVANGDAVSGSTIISTWHWRSGTNDTVLGNDGSIYYPEYGKYPAMIQGIEYAVGGYEVFEDVILRISNGYYAPYLAKRKSHHATSITDNMYTNDMKSSQFETTAWFYISKLSYDGESFFPTETSGASSTTYTRDAFYKNSTSTTTADREWLAFGALSSGSAHGGLSSLHGINALSTSSWSCLARLSVCGNRG